MPRELGRATAYSLHYRNSVDIPSPGGTTLLIAMPLCHPGTQKVPTRRISTPFRPYAPTQNAPKHAHRFPPPTALRRPICCCCCCCCCCRRRRRRRRDKTRTWEGRGEEGEQVGVGQAAELGLDCVQVLDLHLPCVMKDTASFRDERYGTREAIELLVESAGSGSPPAQEG